MLWSLGACALNLSQLMPATNGYNMRLFLALTLFPVAVFGKDSVQSYSVPKEAPPKLMSLGNAAAATTTDAKPLTWTAPNGWQEKPASRMRIGQFAVPGPDGSKAELAVTAFPGDVGGELANVNRWRAEVGLSPIEEKEIKSEPVTVGSDTGKLYELAGANQTTLVAWALKDQTSYFFKLRGDKAAVANARPAMIEFLKSIKFQAAPSMEAAATIGDSSVANPHGNMPGMDAATGLPAGHPPMGGMPSGHPPVDSAATAAPAMPGMGALPANAPEGPQPTWDIPTHWKEQPAPRFVLKSFAVVDDKAGKATATISSLPGPGGGTLGNVNRWRGQLGLAPIAEADLPTATKPVDVAGGKGTLVDFTGKDTAGKPARMVAVIVPRTDAVWFYKLMGDSAEVEHETPNLLKLVQTVRFP